MSFAHGRAMVLSRVTRFLCAAALVQTVPGCGGKSASVDSTDGGSMSTSGSGGSLGETVGGSGVGGSTGGRDAYDAAAACSEPQQPGRMPWYDFTPPLEGNANGQSLTFTGTVVQADVKTIVIDSCEDDAGCAPSLHTLTAKSGSPLDEFPADLTLSIPIGTRVSVDAGSYSVGSIECNGLQSWLVISDAPKGSPEDAGAPKDPWLILAHDNCVDPSYLAKRLSTVFGLGSMATACERNYCHEVIPRKMKVMPGPGWTGADLVLAQGEASSWTVSSGATTRSYHVRNLLSYLDGTDTIPPGSMCYDPAGGWGYWLSR
jgi:hypothetical protein